MLLSIIIPVYNVQDYLETCLNSILDGDQTDYEIILVNDASTDRSGEICNTYSKRFEHVKVVHLPFNHLPAGARNKGISIAKGEYLHFCDSDDHYLKDGLKNILDTLKIKKPEVLIGKFTCNPEKGAFVCSDFSYPEDIYNEDKVEKLIEYFCGLPKYTCTTWRIIIKRELLMKKNLFFLENFHVEDEEWLPRVFCSAETFSILKTPFYCYRPRATGSITSTKNYDITKAHLVMALSLMDFLYKTNLRGVHKEFIISRIRVLIGLFSTRCDTLNRYQIQELSGYINDKWRRNKEILEIDLGECQLLKFVKAYGASKGLQLYKTHVIEETLGCVQGKESYEIYVFPTGFNGEGTARILQDSGYNIKGFVDNSDIKIGGEIDSLPVYSPNIFKDRSVDELLVVVSVQQDVIVKDIMNQLKGLGFKDNNIVGRIY